MGATVIIDAFWGDSGKGKTCAHLATKMNADLAVRAGVGTNAGASFTLPDGTQVKQRQLPTAWVNPRSRLAVGPGVLVHPETLFAEMARYGLRGRTIVDSRCGLITSEDIVADRNDRFLRETVGTSGSGVGPARAQCVNRKSAQARHLAELAPLCEDVAVDANARCAAGEKVLIESAQGTQLSVSLSYEYPCTTVKNCTTAAAIDDVGLNWRHIDDVVLVVKAMPSRVGEGPLPYEMSNAEAESRGHRRVRGQHRPAAAQSASHRRRSVVLCLHAEWPDPDCPHLRRPSRPGEPYSDIERGDHAAGPRSDRTRRTDRRCSRHAAGYRPAADPHDRSLGMRTEA